MQGVLSTLGVGNESITDVCFSGTAIVNGLHIERKYLIQLAKERGCHVHKRVSTEGNHHGKFPFKTLICIVPDDVATMKVQFKTKKINACISNFNCHFLSVSSFLNSCGVI